MMTAVMVVGGCTTVGGGVEQGFRHGANNCLQVSGYGRILAWKRHYSDRCAGIRKDARVGAYTTDDSA
ncbi:hypothetical protein L1987_80662 [Smallanthus sonchifolius]|uniref:Uncharacterized protein n=1 Tax=Smallanthus sonchifolius TaxID=185202 RepID=A0ACB8YN83_9ASTR|nr:hypothetical protein L1987_80662 [Smallanthus sonchifolius]